MKSKSLVPAVLLLTLSAPAISGASATAQRARTRTPAEAVEVKWGALSCENIALAGDYLRDGAGASTEARAAWNAFHNAVDPTIRAFAGRFFKSSSDMDDCCQEVWMDLIRNLPDFDYDRSRGRFSSWLFAIVRNKATDIVRRQARRSAEPITAAQDHPDRNVENPSERLERTAAIDSVRAALNELKSSTTPDNYRLLHMRHVEGRDVADVAEALGITPSQVWAREHRLKGKLRKMLSGPRETARA
jgi:RNA polymerase sigma-70 factor, ECF subfamily